MDLNDVKNAVCSFVIEETNGTDSIAIAKKLNLKPELIENILAALLNEGKLTRIILIAEFWKDGNN